jgi:hypothetical protein
MTDWTALLDAIDEGLTSSPPVLVDFAPADLGPLPAALAIRAEATLQRMAATEAALERDRSEIARELVGLATARTAAASTATPNVPRFLDTRA